MNAITKTMLEQLGDLVGMASNVRILDSDNEVDLKINGKWAVMVYDEATDYYNVRIFGRKLETEADEQGLDFDQAPDMIWRYVVEAKK